VVTDKGLGVFLSRGTSEANFQRDPVSRENALNQRPPRASWKAPTSATPTGIRDKFLMVRKNAQSDRSKTRRCAQQAATILLPVVRCLSMQHLFAIGTCRCLDIIDWASVPITGVRSSDVRRGGHSCIPRSYDATRCRAQEIRRGGGVGRTI
jgi:hypothetical protein